jgi:hypothetical protein
MTLVSNLGLKNLEILYPGSKRLIHFDCDLPLENFVLVPLQFTLEIFLFPHRKLIKNPKGPVTFLLLHWRCYTMEDSATAASQNDVGITQLTCHIMTSFHNLLYDRIFSIKKSTVLPFSE